MCRARPRRLDSLESLSHRSDDPCLAKVLCTSSRVCMPTPAKTQVTSAVAGVESPSSLPARARQVLALCALTIQNTALVLLTKYSYRDAATPYAVSTVIASAESLKIVLSYLLVSTFDGQHVARDALREAPSNAPRLALPSILYVLQNNLLFYGVRLLNPTVYIVCSQSKILTSALWSFLLLRKRITRKQCLALALLVCGMILVQKTKDTPGRLSSHVDVVRAGGTIQGMFAVFTGALISGFVGAYLEKMYKEGLSQNKTIWSRNLQLACFSLPMAALVAFTQDREQFSNYGVFHGYNGIVICIIALQALGGLVVALVLRHAGNVLKCFAVSISICSCAVATIMFSDDGDQTISSHVLLGVGIVIGSTFLYIEV